jgi:hypothetical protein
MGRLVNALVVGAVAVLVAVAAVDALRDDREEAVPTAIRGELVWSDRDCRRHAVRLPDLAQRDFRTVGCGVFTRYDNLGVKDGEVAWFAYPVPGGTTTLLSREALRREVGGRFRVTSVAWLLGVRFAAIISGPRTLLTVWEGPELTNVVGPTQGTDLRASPTGRFFALLGTRSLQVYDRHGNQLALPGGRAIAWSPGERYAAVATEGRLLIVPAAGGEAVAEIAVDAVDVDWRR